MFGTIVVGVDASAGSRGAVQVGAVLAEAMDAGLELAHAYPYDLLPLEGTVTEVEVSEELHNDALRQTEAIRDELAPKATVRVLPDTSPARALHEICEEDGARLLVLGAAGSIATAALHHAPCPVLIARTALPWRTVGVGFDGSPESLHAREVAAVVAEALEARLIPMTVLSDRKGDEPLDDDDGVEALHGKPAQALAERAADLDLLVVGSRGWGPVRRLLMGSTSEKVVKDAPSSVLVVPRGD
jgi:nucleotide-binding universal stress UspA family protein